MNCEHIIKRYIPRVKEKYSTNPDSFGWYAKEFDGFHTEYNRVIAKIKKYTEAIFTLWCESNYSDVPFSVIYNWYKRRDRVENLLWRKIYLPLNDELNQYCLTTDPIVLVMEKWSNGVFPPFNKPYIIDPKKDEDWITMYYRRTALILYLKSKLKQLEEIVDRNKNDLDKLIKLAQIAVNKKSITEDFKEEKNKEEKG